MFSEFTHDGFLTTLQNYNLDIWPLQIFSYVLGIFAIILVIKKTQFSNRVISLILTLYWFWNGIIFSMIYWSSSFKYAYIFGVLLIIQGAIFLISYIKQNISFSYRSDFYSTIGIILILYSMIGYPIIGLFIGHVYPHFFPFGLVPCPTTIFTLGLLLWTERMLPKYIIIIPALWSLSGYIAVSRGIYEDIGLIALGLLAVFLIFYRDLQQKTAISNAI